jgi:hypothetical protein
VINPLRLPFSCATESVLMMNCRIGHEYGFYLIVLLYCVCVRIGIVTICNTSAPETFCDQTVHIVSLLRVIVLNNFCFSFRIIVCNIFYFFMFVVLALVMSLE